jgi:hypothetical protein
MATKIGGPAVPVAHATNPIDFATVAAAVVKEPVWIEDASGHLSNGDDDVAGGESEFSVRESRPNSGGGELEGSADDLSGATDRLRVGKVHSSRWIQ